MVFVLLLSLAQGPAAHRAKAEAYLEKKQYQQAAESFFKAADGYQSLGDPNAAKVLRDRGKRYFSTLELYEQVPPSDQRLARGEPAAGMYLGVNIEREEASRYPQSFNNLIGKPHAMFFMYRKYGVAFPKAYAQELKKAGAALQIAWEPSSLRDVQDNNYLRGFAKDIRDSGIPVFVRFASEMNGDWTPYHGDPPSYRQKFRLVADVLHAECPNAIMVWCPNSIPEEPIANYYPGEDVVDWVGVNFYSVMYNDSDRARAADWRFPTDSIEYVYNRYAAKHPIMIAEWAASHRASIDGADRPSFTIQKIEEFFRTVPTKFPRLKAASWLSFNALKYAKGDRQLNNYSLFDNPAVAQSYQTEIAHPHYLSKVGQSAQATWKQVASKTLSPQKRYRIFLRSYDPLSTISINGFKERLRLGSEFEVPKTEKTLSMKLLDSENRLVLESKFQIK